MYWFNYKHIYCECGGVIGSFDKGFKFICGGCKKEYQLNNIKYDIMLTNDKTGWVFPMLKKKG